jgi:hypothetical protein
MKVRLLKNWRYRKIGTVLNEVPDGAANLLIRRGIAETVEVKPEPKPEPARNAKRVRA